MPKLANTRRQITDLSDELQMRELNRQLEWIYRQLYGGLSIINFSETGKQEIIDLVSSSDNNTNSQE